MRTAYASCPTELVDAPVAVVWDLLTEPASWGTFFDVRVQVVDPPGRAAVGQRCLAESGPRFLHLRVAFEFTAIDAEKHRLGIRVRLPFGIDVQEELDCVPVAEKQCRVNYHCNFDLPAGVRGWIVRTMIRRELDEGPRDSLLRLKRAAEERAGVRPRSKPSPRRPRR
jgi:hypothetical protein